MPTKPNSAEYLTELPVTSSASLTDIIYAVQGYVSPENPGLSIQQTLAQVHALFQTTLTVSGNGNPNGAVAGTIFEFYWDTTNGILYICTQAGNASNAIWNKVIRLTGGSGITISQAGDNIQISNSGSGITFNDVTGTMQTMMPNNAYQANNSSLVQLTLPATSAFGDSLLISGYGAGGWTIVQTAGQQIIVGDEQTTVGDTPTQRRVLRRRLSTRARGTHNLSALCE